LFSFQLLKSIMKMITYFMKPHLIVLLNLDNLLSNF